MFFIQKRTHLNLYLVLEGEIKMLSATFTIGDTKCAEPKLTNTFFVSQILFSDYHYLDHDTKCSYLCRSKKFRKLWPNSSVNTHRTIITTLTETYPRMTTSLLRPSKFQPSFQRLTAWVQQLYWGSTGGGK